MEEHQRFITITGDVGTYKAVTCQNLKSALDSIHYSCTILLDNDSFANSFHVFLTANKVEARREQKEEKLMQYDLVLNINELTEEEVIQTIIEMYMKRSD